MNGIKKTLLATISCLIFFHVAKAQDINESALPDEIRLITIASEPDYPPYCIVDENGNADGFSVDLFKAAADAVGIEVSIKIGVWNQIRQDLAEGRIDALPLVGRTPERENLYFGFITYG